MSFVPCAIVPSHDHWTALPGVVARLRAAGLAVFVIDDGSGEPAASAIAALHAPQDGVVVRRLAVNRGKGEAVVAGFRDALAAGCTHAVQVDADGQHDLDALPRLLDGARRHPHALVSGAPVYDESVPAGRRIGRWVTHLWVFVETLSLRITDSMCGFRVYPLAAVERLLAEERVGAGMDFDTDIMVRLFWRGVPPLMVPVRVTYPPGNTSNFDVLGDNVRISRMHARLFLGMLVRLPRILAHRPPPLAKGAHWAGLAERGALWGLRFVALAYRLLGRRGCMAVLAPIVFYFHATGTAQRRASRDYLRRVLGRAPGWTDTYRHFLDFAGRALDTFAAWIGAHGRDAVVLDDAEAFLRAAADPRGALLVVSHHGNVDISRAVMESGLRERLTVLVHTRHAENYNRVVREFRPEAAARMVQVTDIGPDTAIMLGQCVERGEWVAIAGDRVPVSSRGHTSLVPFLGEPAAFSHGPWLLGALLGCPVHLLFCRRERPGRWRASLELFAERISLPRGARADALAEYAAAYARRLETECRKAPWQWYNFFDFWGGDTR
ncbi:MAG: glycosyltransferase [Magnetospirillum sp.]|nr:glycosyltransferase [Magnetospirillum sp.]